MVLPNENSARLLPNTTFPEGEVRLSKLPNAASDSALYHNCYNLVISIARFESNK